MVCYNRIYTIGYSIWLYSGIIIIIKYLLLIYFLKRVYIASSRQLRRLDSVTRSSIFANFGETIQGVTSIRAYHVQQRFTDVSDKFMDRNQSCHLASTVSNRFELIHHQYWSNVSLFCSLSDG